MIDKVAKVELVAKKEGEYTVYVFANLNKFSDIIMCTRLPNWQIPEINIGDVGYLSYQVVFAGENYYDRLSGSTQQYQYSNVYFQNFINLPKITNNRIEL